MTHWRNGAEGDFQTGRKRLKLNLQHPKARVTRMLKEVEEWRKWSKCVSQLGNFDNEIALSKGGCTLLAELNLFFEDATSVSAASTAVQERCG